MLQYNFHNSQLIKSDSYSTIYLGRYHVREGCDTKHVSYINTFFKKKGHSFEICCRNLSVNLENKRFSVHKSTSRKNTLFTKDQQRQFSFIMLLLQD